MDAKMNGGRLFRYLLPVLVIVLLTLAPVVAAQDNAPSVMTRNAEGQTITAWGWDTPEFNRPVLDYIQEASGVTVNDVTYPSAAELDNLRTAAAAGVGLPDVFKRTSTEIPQLVELNAIRDITDLVAPYKDLLPDIAWEEVTYQGKIWGVPANSPAGGVFWRQDVLEQYGIDPTKIVTWDDFIAAGQQIASASNGAVSLIQTPATGLPWPIPQTIQQQFRAELIGADGTVKIGPDSTEWQNTLALWRKVHDANLGVEMDQWTPPWYTAMQDGSIAAFPSGTWFVETLIQQAPDTTGDWYFTPFPSVTADGDRYPYFGSATCFISSTTEHPEAAMEWVKAWTIDPHGAIEIGLKELGISVVGEAALNNPFVTAPHEYFAQDQAYWLDATEAFFKTTYVPPASANDAEANDIFNRHLEQWWLGNETDQQFLQNVADELRSTLGLS